MPRPVNGYFNAAGQKIPSVTQILSRFKESGGLMFWAFKQGQERPHGQLYEETTKAADVGTLAHMMVEASIKGERTIKAKDIGPDLIEKARQAFEMYRTWANQTKLKVIHTEISLISETHQFGGTGDGIGEIDGELCGVEWKVTNAIYTDNLIQMAANGLLWEENHPDQPLTGGYHLCRFSKEEGDFAHFHFKDLSGARRLFLLYREAYGLDKQLKKRLS